jgi:hypothetical protein
MSIDCNNVDCSGCKKSLKETRLMKPISREMLTMTSTKIFALLLGAMITSATLANAAHLQTSKPAATAGATTAERSSSALHHESYTLEFDGSKQWRDTGIDLHSGQSVRITASGVVTNAKGDQFGPEGITGGDRNQQHRSALRGSGPHAYALPTSPHGELIGRIGSGDAAKLFEVGTGATYAVPVAGRLFLGMNQTARDAAGTTGVFQVKIELLSEL